MSDKPNLHSGHRARMKRRFIKSNRSFAAFSEHEVLEMLLFNCYTRRNTNEIAHDLINRFGSIKNALNAPEKELCEVKNISKTVAANLRFYGELYNYLVHDGSYKADISDIGFLREYLNDALKSRGHGLYILAQSDDPEPLLYQCDENDLFPVKMRLLTDKAARVVSVRYLQENSENDISSDTPVINELSSFCGANDIEYCDHFIFEPDNIKSLKENDMF